MTNFQLLYEEKTHHEWAGVERYQIASEMLQNAQDECIDNKFAY